MSRIRVYLLTFRRPQLLRRALRSLLAQTCTDWVCELHNDAPDDSSPQTILAELAPGDTRFEYRPHGQNLGPVATFNLVHRPAAEDFFSILEDDNWWEPVFLETLLGALSTNTDATLAWCNQRIWQESRDGTWLDTGACAQPTATPPHPIRIFWGDRRQALGALHANGAMLVRTRPDQDLATPPDLPFTGVEPYRERRIAHPLIYIPAPLAHFARTLQTARTKDFAEWSAFQTALLATYVKNSRLDRAGLASLWAAYRRQTPAPTNVFIHAGLMCRDCRPLLRHTTPRDWWRYALSAARRPASLWRSLRVRQRHPQWWAGLDASTAARFAAARPPSPTANL